MTTRWVVSLSIILAARLASAEVCESQRHSFELDPSPESELNVGECYEHQGDAVQARRWYQDAARRFALAGNAEGQQFARERLDAVERTPTPEPVDHHRRSWKIAFWSSIGLAAVSSTVWALGAHEISDAQAQLCAGGAYAFNASCGTPAMPLTQQQVAQLNAQGFHGHDLVIAGGIGVGIAGGAAIVSMYEAYLRHEAPRREPVVVTPVVGRGTGGAVAQWSW